MINALIDECRKIFTILFIVWLCILCVNIIGCATTNTIPVVVKPVYPMLVACPDLQHATASNIADVIADMQTNYMLCKQEVDITIIYFKEINK